MNTPYLFQTFVTSQYRTQADNSRIRENYLSKQKYVNEIQSCQMLELPANGLRAIVSRDRGESLA